MTIWQMSLECWIHEATKTHAEYVILIAFTLKQGLQERSSVLRHEYQFCYDQEVECLLRGTYWFF